MADSTIAITAGTGTNVRTVTNAGVDGGAHQQVVTLADAAGAALGTTAAPVPVLTPATAVTTGNLAALNAVVDGATDVSAYASVRVMVTGTFVATFTFQVSMDGTNWYSKTLGNTFNYSATASNGAGGVWYGDISARYFRVQLTAYTSGTAVVAVQYSAAPSATPLYAIGLNAGTAYVGQVRLTDGTNSATVKAASTAAAAADTAGVVALHPSSPAYLAPSTAVVTATAAAATAVTATLTAPAAGLSHYITHVRIERFMTAAGTGAGTATLTGGTNHGLIFNLPTDAAAIGTQSVPVDYRPTTPLKVTAAATATTFTAPAVAGTIYRITVSYYTAA